MPRSATITVAVLLLASCATETPTTPPCGGSQPLGCSIPKVVLVIDEYGEQADKFHAACVTHDLCYRHGAATYDLSREDCDEEFYDNMKAACSGTAGLGVLDPEGFAKCQIAANQTYQAVRKHGEKHYRDATTGVACEYR